MMDLKLEENLQHEVVTMAINDNDMNIMTTEGETPNDEKPNDLVTMATEALQSHSRLHQNLRRCKRQFSSTSVFDKSVETLENLREIKSVLDGSSVDFKDPTICRDNLLELRQLLLMHVPASVTEAVRERFQDLIDKTFKDACVKLLCAVMVTCPWYEVTQRERGEQARHNVLYVVYMSHDQQFLAPVNPHHLEKAFVTDEGWLYAVELNHFVKFLVKGKTRCLEVLYCPQQARLYEDVTWSSLRNSLDSKSVMGLQGFIEACRGQSAGKIGKKGKDGKFRLRESSTFQEFCDSFRLTHHLYNLIHELPPCTELFNVDALPPIGQEGAQLLMNLYQNPDVSKRDIFSVLMKWREEVTSQVSKVKAASSHNKEVEGIVGKWQSETRLQGRQLILPSLPDEHTSLLTLMETIGGPVAKLYPQQILLIARAGSYMYNLSTPTSDVDYMIIYAEKTQDLLGRCKEIKDNFESRGPTKQFEYGAYEARLFGEMLLKGSVVILELVYADGHEYISPMWKKLSEKRELFVTEKGIQQYLGLIRNNFNLLDGEKHRGTPRDKKLFYQIFHKMDSVRYMMEGRPPPVRCTGTVRDYIMRLRTQPLEGELDRDMLYHTAKDKFRKLEDDLAARTNRLKENMDYSLVTDWLMCVRGIDQPL